MENVMLQLIQVYFQLKKLKLLLLFTTLIETLSIKTKKTCWTNVGLKKIRPSSSLLKSLIT